MRIVVADDYRDTAELLAQVVQFAGHEVAVAYDGLSALEVIESTMPRVAILDIDMPGMDGLTLAGLLRLRYGGTMTLIAISGRVTPEGPNLEHSPFDEALGKPFDVDDLLARLPSEPA